MVSQNQTQITSVPQTEEQRKDILKVLTPNGVKTIERTPEAVKKLARELGIRRFYLTDSAGKMIGPEDLSNATSVELIPYQEAGSS